MLATSELRSAMRPSLNRRISDGIHVPLCPLDVLLQPPRGGFSCGASIARRSGVSLPSTACPRSVAEKVSVRGGAELEVRADESGSNTAVVIGGGVAGITAARALSPHFKRVVLVERDRPEAYQGRQVGRQGAPQSYQAHVLLVGGCTAMEQMFPGFMQDMQKAGAVEYDFIRNRHWYDYGTYLNKPPEGAKSVPMRTMGTTRWLLESVLLHRLLEEPHIHLDTGSVCGLLWSSDQSRVQGVRLKDGGEIRGELVVDATGRGSMVREYLAEAGAQELPEPEVVSPGLVYMSCLIPRPPDWPKDKMLTAVLDKPKSPVMGALLPVEDSKWMLICCGPSSDPPPQDPEALIQWTARLPKQDVYEAIKGMTPVTKPRPFRQTDSVNMHFEKVAMPDGLVVVGDAVCTFNPVYGQGMTVATLGAMLLGTLLRDRLRSGEAATSSARLLALQGLPQEFQAQLAKQLKFPWGVATSSDLKALRARGLAPPARRSALDKLKSAYMDCVLTAGLRDWRVYNIVLSVMHMVLPQSALFRPQVVAAALLVALNKTLVGLPGYGAVTNFVGTFKKSLTGPDSLQST